MCGSEYGLYLGGMLFHSSETLRNSVSRPQRVSNSRGNMFSEK